MHQYGGNDVRWKLAIAEYFSETKFPVDATATLSVKLYSANIKPIIISQQTREGVVHTSAISNVALIKTDQSEAFIPMLFQANFNTTLLLHQVILELFWIASALALSFNLKAKL